MITPELKSAFQHHIRLHAGKHLPKNVRAVTAMFLARRDVEAGKRFYPAPLKPYPPVSRPVNIEQGHVAFVEDPARIGLRFVGSVMPEYRRASELWQRHGDQCGWFTDPDQNGRAYGVVYQLTGRNGLCRFVAGYVFSEDDYGPSVDFSRVFSEIADGDSAKNSGAARDAAIYANDMAKREAEMEYEYQTAWQAGARYADKQQDIGTAREEVMAILAERKGLKGQTAYPALCAAIKARVADLLTEIRDSRADCKALINGDHTDLHFWPGEQRLKDAFNDGAGLAEAMRF